MSENPRIDQAIKLYEASWDEAFRLATRVLKRHEPKELMESEHKERYWSSLPMIAAEMRNYLYGLAHFLSEAPEKTKEDQFGVIGNILAELRKIQS